MTPEELQELKDAKAGYYTEIVLKAKEAAELRQKLHLAEETLDDLKSRYHELDREIAMEERLTICEPTGLGAKKKFGICGLTKKQALAIIEGLEDEEDE